jgi:hypothetical protein
MLTKFFTCSLLCVMLVPSVLHAADSKADKAANKQAADTQGDAAASSTDDAKAKGRLPQGWGKLGITDAQKQSVYKVQTGYEAKIDALKKQLSDLESQRDAEMRNVLTDTQRKQLDDAASTKSSKKAAATDSKNSAAANSNKTSSSDAK